MMVFVQPRHARKNPVAGAHAAGNYSRERGSATSEKFRGEWVKKMRNCRARWTRREPEEAGPREPNAKDGMEPNPQVRIILKRYG